MMGRVRSFRPRKKIYKNPILRQNWKNFFRFLFFLLLTYKKVFVYKKNISFFLFLFSLSKSADSLPQVSINNVWLAGSFLFDKHSTQRKDIFYYKAYETEKYFFNIWKTGQLECTEQVVFIAKQFNVT